MCETPYGASGRWLWRLATAFLGKHVRMGPIVLDWSRTTKRYLGTQSLIGIIRVCFLVKADQWRKR